MFALDQWQELSLKGARSGILSPLRPHTGVFGQVCELVLDDEHVAGGG